MIRTGSFKSFIQRIAWILIIWILAAFLFGSIRVWGVESLPAYERVLPFEPGNFILQMFVLGIAIGIPFGLMDYVLNSDWLSKRSYWVIIFTKGIIQFLIAMFSIGVLVLVSNWLYFDNRFNFVDLLFSSTSFLWIVYTGVFSFFIYFFDVFKTQIGERVLVNLILGKYHYPRVEQRIFMFLDMKDSTTHAENLGHIKFSSLIQDSLNDLTSAIIEHKVEVYQYVGDEAILTWDMQEGFENANCLQVYFSFQKTLHNKKENYENKYGFVPFFKAGAHLGEVTVSEVGIIKREIAYHSDVLNTAARIQGKCNDFQAELLISDDLKSRLENQQNFNFEHIGGLSLKGKQQLVNIYKVSLI